MTLPELSVGDRLERLRAAMVALDDAPGALMVTRPANVRYLSGFTGSAGTLLVGSDDVVLVTDGRYGEQAREQLAHSGCAATVEVLGAGQRERMGAILGDWAVSHVGLEAHGVSWALRDDLAGALAPVEVVPTRDVVEDLRRVKEPAEVARIAAACAIADEALEQVRPLLRERASEREVALALELEMRRAGATGTSFDPIVAGGPRSAMPHARPTDAPIEAGSLVVLDFGCIVDGYCSDMTRTVSVGDPGPEAVELYELVARSQEAGRAAVRGGVAASAVDAASREVIDAAGLGELFTHGTGHGVGLEIHEAPRVAATSGDTLAAGHVVTVEPGVYRPGVGGVRIEDTVVVTPEGAEVLTRASKELIL